MGINIKKSVPATKDDLEIVVQVIAQNKELIIRALKGSTEHFDKIDPLVTLLDGLTYIAPCGGYRD